MKLVFTNSGVIGKGQHPDFVQYPNTAGQLFYIKDGKLYGDLSEEFDGEFDSPVFLPERKMTRDLSITGLELKTLAGYGLVGSYRMWNSKKQVYQHKIVVCLYDDLLNKLF